MNKAILVIDMPRFCNECSLMYQDGFSYWCPVKCNENKTDLYEDYIKFYRKPDWCPLKEFPEKKKMFASMNAPLSDYSDFEYGYNRCISEILE